MIKRFIQLIRGRFSRQVPHQSPRPPLVQLSAQPSPRPGQNAAHTHHTPAHVSNNVISAVSRTEIVDKLNRTLQQSSPARTSQSRRCENYQASHRQDPDTAPPYTIASLADAAFLCERQRRYGEAERLYKQVITMRQQQFGDQQICVAESLSELAALYQFQQRHDEAQALLQQALTIRRHRLASHHLEIGINLHQLANTYRHQRLYAKAEPLFQQALTILRQQLGSDNLQTQSVYSDLMQMLATAIESGQFDKLETALPPADSIKLRETYHRAKPNWDQ